MRVSRVSGRCPPRARGIVLFAHGSGSSRHSPRNRHVAEGLRETRFATLLFDLLTPEDDRPRYALRRAASSRRLVAAIVVGRGKHGDGGPADRLLRRRAPARPRRWWRRRRSRRGSPPWYRAAAAPTWPRAHAAPGARRDAVHRRRPRRGRAELNRRRPPPALRARGGRHSRRHAPVPRAGRAGRGRAAGARAGSRSTCARRGWTGRGEARARSRPTRRSFQWCCCASRWRAARSRSAPSDPDLPVVAGRRRCAPVAWAGDRPVGNHPRRVTDDSEVPHAAFTERPVAPRHHDRDRGRARVRVLRPDPHVPDVQRRRDVLLRARAARRRQTDGVGDPQPAAEVGGR